MALTLMKGSEAIAEAAIRAGCRYFFGYPITPQTEIPEYMSERMPEIGGCFLQAESEVGAINMVYGAAGTGERVLTSSSSPGVSLKQEGISYIAGAQLPCVIMNVMRGGPGLGSIQAGQGDYFQATKGGGHGDYHLVVFAPASVQESIDLMSVAFDTADKYQCPVMVVADGMICQMMEPVVLPEMKEYKVDLEKKPWAANGHGFTKPAGRSIINSMYINTEDLTVHNENLQAHLSRDREERSPLRGLQHGERRDRRHRLRHRRAYRQERHRRPEGGGLQRRPVPSHHPLALPVQGASRRGHGSRREGCPRRRAERRPDVRGCQARHERRDQGRAPQPPRQPDADSEEIKEKLLSMREVL